MADPSGPTGIGVPCHVVVADEQTDVVVETERWGELAAAVLRAEGRVGELTLTFVDRGEIAALNAEHMGRAEPTDVLSFPLDAGEAVVPAGPVLLGDVVICPAVAADAAPNHAGSVDDELALLTVHGVLHVLGHDHADPDERAEMRARELRHLVDLHWRGPAPEGFRHEPGES
ncbi:rRNA maturation RNase YbeY [Ilumatobacter sp.]|uniref:rRNA maturation RNase YbeY n=1 Tax=Ilumatobacter sp. TaxID=1967498 RepID=UPI003AF6FAE8